MTDPGEDTPVLQAAQFVWAQDDCLRTPCHPWCSIHCDGTAHSGESAEVERKYGRPLSVFIDQPTNVRYPVIVITDEYAERKDTVTPDQAEHFAHVLLDLAKVTRAAVAEEAL